MHLPPGGACLGVSGVLKPRETTGEYLCGKLVMSGVLGLCGPLGVPGRGGGEGRLLLLSPPPDAKHG